MAAKYYAKAAQSKNAEAMYNLALFYQKGLGVKVDYKMSLSLLKQAASQNPMRNINGMEIPNVGVAEAEHALGLAYNEGVYVDKNTCIAAKWYEKAVKHNSSNSANNLGILYMTGDGVEQNLDKAEELFLLSHKLDNIDSIFSLINLYLVKNDPERALMWHERALKSDKSVLALSRDKEIREICENKMKLKSFKENDSKNTESLKVADELSDFTNKWVNKKITPYMAREKFIKNENIQNTALLLEYASNGSIQAQNMVDSQFSFYSAIFMLDESDLDKYDFVNLMSEAFKTEQFTWSIDEKKREKALQIIEEIISEKRVSEADCNARICYMYLKLDKIIPFISESLKKYPNNLVMLDLRGSMYGFENKWDMALKDFEKILESDPHNYHYLYHKATASFQSQDKNERNIKIKHYEKFLEYSPRDYRKVPEAYYTMATLNLVQTESNETFGSEKAKEYYNKGIDSEKFMLPCFLPYESDKKIALEIALKFYKVLMDKETSKSKLNEPLMVKESNLNPEKIFNRESIINDYRRKALVLDHRTYYSGFKSSLGEKNSVIFTTAPPKQQKLPASFANLKALILKDIDFSHDHIMDGYVLAMINIDVPLYQPPPLSTRLLAQDEHGMVERVAIYNLGLSEKSILETYKIGCKFSIINPYIRMANDMKPMIRIDDPITIILSDEQMTNPCCLCLKEDSKYNCSKCHRAKYCSRECQIADWKIFQHKTICSN
jgi:tetratricopeptide (TPR) repeat protein